MYRFVDLLLDLLVPLYEVLVLTNGERSRLQLPILRYQTLQMPSPFFTLCLALLQLLEGQVLLLLD